MRLKKIIEIEEKTWKLKKKFQFQLGNIFSQEPRQMIPHSNISEMKKN